MDRSQALQYIDQLSEQEKLEESTHRYALIVIDLISDAAPEELSAWIWRQALAWVASNRC